MWRRFMFLMAMLVAGVAYTPIVGSNFTYNETIVIEMDESDSLVSTGWAYKTSTHYISSALNRDMVFGRIIMEASNYTTGSFGADDTVRMVLRSSLGELVWMLDSVECVGLPCTTTVYQRGDTLFGELLYLDWTWVDSIVVAINDTARTNIKLILKFAGDAIQ